MATLTILRGVSGSGKSTWARTQPAMVVSRDGLRKYLFGSDDQDYYAVPRAVLKQREETISRVQDSAIETNLSAGYDVVVDNTNVQWEFVEALADIAESVGATVQIKVFDVGLGLAITRNAIRKSQGGRSVPPDVIAKQHKTLQGNKNRRLP